MKFLIGIRTNNIDFQTICLLNYYKSNNIDCVLCVDELNEKKENYGFDIVSINKSFLDRNNLNINISKPLLWNCGDYFFYGMIEKHPNYDGYWLVEDDALIKSSNLKELLSRPLYDNIDFSAHAMNFLKKNQDWLWRDSIQKSLNIDEIETCLFSIVFASKSFLIDAFNKRVINCQLFSSTYKDYIYPNDEGFMMNYLNKSKFKYKSLQELYGTEYIKNLKFSSSKDIFYFDQALSNNLNGFFHPILINQNLMHSINREVKILRKQKKDVVAIASKNQEIILNHLSKLQSPKYFCFVFYGKDGSKNSEIKEFTHPVSCFFIEDNINDSIFLTNLEKIINNNIKFNSFILIDKDISVDKNNYLDAFNALTVSNNRTKVYFNNKINKIDNRIFIFARENFNDIKKILKNDFEVENLDFINHYLDINNYFKLT